MLTNVYHTGKPAISFELFPPKKWKGMAGLFQHFDELAQCKPAFVTCTYGAGGGDTIAKRTLELLGWIHGDYPNLPVMSHLTCVSMPPNDIRAYIAEAAQRGVRGIVALRGDAPRDDPDFVLPPDAFQHASDLVAMIREEFPAMSIAVAGYPEKHPEAPDFTQDIAFLKEKVDRGAHVVITQLFYDNAHYFRFRDQCVAAGITVPIVPGILPVTNLAQVKRIAGLCGAQMPSRLIERLEKHADDEEGQFSVGVYFAGRQVEELIEQGAPGIHFYVMNKSRAAALICRALTL